MGEQQESEKMLKIQMTYFEAQNIVNEFRSNESYLKTLIGHFTEKTPEDYKELNRYGKIFLGIAQRITKFRSSKIEQKVKDTQKGQGKLDFS